MTSPATRLLWVTALTVVPACTLLGIAPSSRLPASFLLLGCALVFAADAFRGYRRLSTLQVTAPDFLKAFKGRSMSLPLQISADPSLSGTASLPDLAVSAQFSGSTALAIPFLPSRRGLVSLAAVEVEALSPWKFWRTAARRTVTTQIRVFPDLAADPTAKLLLAARMGTGRTQRLVGRGREYERLREYVPGDSYDEIYWKATARRGKPVVRVFQMERTQDIYAIVDSSRLSARNNAAEEFVTAALSLALAAENAGDNFGLVTFSDRVNRFLPAVHGRAHFARCRDTIYDLEPERVSPDLAELFTFLQIHIRRRALLFFLTDLSDVILAETFAREAPMLARRHIVALNPLRSGDDHPLFTGPPPQSRNEIAERLSRHIHWGRQRDLARKLQHSGIRTLPLRSGNSAHDLVEHYHAIKERQLL